MCPRFSFVGVHVMVCMCYAVDVHIHAHHIQSLNHTIMHTDLSIEELKNASESADRFIDQHGDCGLAYETVLLLCFVKAATARPVINNTMTVSASIARKVAGGAQPIPEWFTEGVKQLAGRRVTASVVLSALGRQADMKALRDAGAWLRQLYGQPSRSGGQTLFVISSSDAASAAQASDDNENPLGAGIPLGSRAINFAMLRAEGRYTPAEIANHLGHQGTAREIVEIGKALTDNGYPFDAEGYFSMSKLR